mgnify:CR=1 FL=1
MSVAGPLRFDALSSTRPRKVPASCVVLHWTGGAGGAEQVYRTLRSRIGPKTRDGLSIHYVVEPDGTEVQMASLDLVCLHAGMMNDVSVGIEIVSPGMARGAAYERERKAGIKRDVYEDRLRGWRRPLEMLDFTAEQTTAVTLLVEQLCTKLSIPKRVPTDETGALLRRTMTPEEMRAFSGVLGHYHCSTVKTDPGTRLLDRLRVRWL